jgi:hypothetical protein
MVRMPGRILVEEAWKKRFEFHPSGQFLYLESFCPFKEHINDLENETN